MKKKYTKRQITEAIAYWKKQLKNGNYRKVLESSNALGLTGPECKLMNDYFTELYSENGKIPARITIQAVEFKDDPGYAGDGPRNYKSMLDTYGKPSVAWIADEWAETALDGRKKRELTEAFQKLVKHGIMACNPNTGIVTFDTKRITMVEDSYGWDVLTIDGEVIK